MFDALGVMLHELLTRRLPQRNLETLSGLHKPEEREIEKPSAVVRRERPAIRSQLAKPEWADLDVLCLEALQPDPQQRYRTVDALMRDLDALLDGRPLEARPNKIGYNHRQVRPP